MRIIRTASRQPANAKPEFINILERTMSDSSTETDTDTKVHIKFPKMWTVVFFNDDFTPMDFVVDVIRNSFQLSIAEAEHLTVKIHEDGEASVGQFSRDIAETKTLEIMQAAAFHSHPLKVQPAPI
jgi:ATP-dependent Clp protease adaptor protein ClpS